MPDGHDMPHDNRSNRSRLVASQPKMSERFGINVPAARDLLPYLNFTPMHDPGQRALLPPKGRAGDTP